MSWLFSPVFGILFAGAFNVEVTPIFDNRIRIITMNNGAPGSSASPNPAGTGETVTLTRGTLAGHRFGGWSISLSGGVKVLKENTFKMPAEAVTVSAIWLSEKDDFVMVPGGKFQMGSPEGTPDSRDYERPVREVTLSAFYMDKYPVTQADYEAVMGSNPSWFYGNNRPVEQVRWYDALVYANRLSVAKELTPAYELPDMWPNPTSYSSNTADWGTRDTRWDNVRVVAGSTGYRLPTEAQWEYAARGGNGSPGNYVYSGSNTIGNVAWYANNVDWTQYVGGKLPNGLGLYDMSGNVSEWVWDWSNKYPSAAQNDPTGASSGSYRVLRGGSWNSSAGLARSAYRFIYGPSSRFNYCGFRLVRPSLTAE